MLNRDKNKLGPASSIRSVSAVKASDLSSTKGGGLSCAMAINPATSILQKILIQTGFARTLHKLDCAKGKM